MRPTVSMHQHGNEPCEFDVPSVSNDNGLYASFRLGGLNGIYFSFQSHIELAKFAAGLAKLSAKFTEYVKGKRAAVADQQLSFCCAEAELALDTPEPLQLLRRQGFDLDRPIAFLRNDGQVTFSQGCAVSLERMFPVPRDWRSIIDPVAEALGDEYAAVERNFQKVAYENGEIVLASGRYDTIEEAAKVSWNNADGWGALSREYKIQREEIREYDGDKLLKSHAMPFHVSLADQHEPA